MEIFWSGGDSRKFWSKRRSIGRKILCAFENKYREQVAELKAKGNSQKVAEKEAPISNEAKRMLLAWENNDKKVRALWEKMNAWVYDGFETYLPKVGGKFRILLL